MSVHQHQCGDHGVPDRDPTGTFKIRRRFDREVTERYDKLRKLVSRTLLGLDVLGAKGASESSISFARLYGDHNPYHAFMAWLRDATAQTVLGPTNARWSDVYVLASYAHGARKATMKCRAAKTRGVWTRIKDADSTDPIHATSLATGYSRTFDSFKNVTDVMLAQVSRIIAEAAMRQWDPEKVNRAVLDRVARIGMTRSRVVVAYETVMSYYAASLNVYSEAGVHNLRIIPEYVPNPQRKVRDATRVYYVPKGRWPKAEWVTQKDDLVCPQCEALDGQIFTIYTASRMLPVHPNCRCDYEPIFDEDA
jgi:hypothetical protein